MPDSIEVFAMIGGGPSAGLLPEFCSVSLQKDSFDQKTGKLEQVFKGDNVAITAIRRRQRWGSVTETIWFLDKDPDSLFYSYMALRDSVNKKEKEKSNGDSAV